MKVGDRVRVKEGQGCRQFYQEGAEGIIFDFYGTDQDVRVLFDKGGFDPDGFDYKPLWFCHTGRVELVEPTQDTGEVETTKGE